MKLFRGTSMRGALALALTGVLGVVSACGSSSQSSSTTKAASATTASASTASASTAPASTAGGTASSTASTAASTSASSDPIAAAQAIVDASQPPTKITATAKSSKPLPKGSNHTIAYIHCGEGGCAVIESAIKAAIKGLGLGWTLQTIPTDNTPESIQNAWNSALRLKPDAIYACCFDETLVKDQLAQAKSQGIPVFDSYSLLDSSDKFFAFAGTSDLNAFSQTMSAWTTVESKGKAKVLFVSLPTFPPLKVVEKNYKSTIATMCPGCTVDTIEFAGTDIGTTGPDKIVSYLRAHPDTDTIVYAYDGVGTGVPAALEAAGLNKKVRIIGQSPSPTSIGYINAGEQSATVTQGYYELWAGVLDATARVISGQDVDPNELKMPAWLYTANSPKTATGSDAPVVPDLYAQFLALWPQS
jgi:ribose transport system substrate-binding protein